MYDFKNKYFTFCEADGTLTFNGNHDIITQTMIPSNLKTHIKNIVISEGVKQIDRCAFADFLNLEKVTISNSVERLCFKAFSGCDNLKNITIGNGVSVIEDDCFYGCVNLNNVYMNSLSNWCNIKFWSPFSNPLAYTAKLYLNNTQIIDVTIPDDIAQIDKFAFIHCEGLRRVVIPNNIKNISYASFYGCKDLEIVKISNGTLAIDEAAFYDCSSLTYISLPDSIEFMGVNALPDNSSNFTIKCKKDGFIDGLCKIKEINTYTSKIDQFINSVNGLDDHTK